MISSYDYETDLARLEKSYKIISLLLVALFLTIYTLLFLFIGSQTIFILWPIVVVLLPFYIYRDDCLKQNKMDLMLRYGLVDRKLKADAEQRLNEMASRLSSALNIKL